MFTLFWRPRATVHPPARAFRLPRKASPGQCLSPKMPASCFVAGSAFVGGKPLCLINQEQEHKRQNRTQEAQEKAVSISFLCFLCSSLCFLCSVPDLLAP